GNPLGGVKPPVPLILPDPTRRFARSAARLRVLSVGHPMAEWLQFMASLASAQHAAAITAEPLSGPNPTAVQQAALTGLPPLAADGHPRHPSWRLGLYRMLDQFDGAAMPAPARAAIGGLRSRRDAAAVERLADAFLRTGVDTTDAAPALYIAAALQIYFTRLATGLHAPSLSLLLQRGLCPSCGSTPVSGVITASGPSPGVRYLYCSLCATAWNHVRAACITCGESGGLALQGIADDAGVAKAEVCNACHTYAKMLYQVRDMDVDPFADDLATIGLDMLMAEAGWSRHASNPLLLTG
ncbi:MAG TPA: formate dehydrogenase accessory protein FdhE, partial [Rhodopila sp.]